MSLTVHNPDQYMGSLRQIIAQGRKRLGLLVGAGAPASIAVPAGGPLIPTTDRLTEMVLDKLKGLYGQPLGAIKAETSPPNVENILSRVRSLASVIGATSVHGLDAGGYKSLGEAICNEIGSIANKSLPDGVTPYSEIVTWISGTDRRHAVEILSAQFCGSSMRGYFGLEKKVKELFDAQC